MTEQIFNQPLEKETEDKIHRAFWNVLVTGHRLGRLPKSEPAQSKVKAALQSIMEELDDIADPRQLRVLAGNSDGVDQWIYDLNASRKNPYPFFRIAPFPQNDEIEESLNFVNNVYISRSSQKKNDAPESWVKASDEIKLDFADVVVSVWDGNPPAGNMGGTVRLLIEALRRHIPVIWIDSSEALAGLVRIPKREIIHLSDLVRLKIAERDLYWVKDEIFRDVSDVFTVKSFFSEKIKNDNFLITNFYDKSKKLDPSDRKTIWGIWHKGFLSLFGREPEKKMPQVIDSLGNETSHVPQTLQEKYLQYFYSLDRTATHAANKYRDRVVLTHLFASMAVLGAVAGSIGRSEMSEGFWGLLELLSLVLIVFLLFDRRKPTNSHDVWLQFRQAAEAFRINAFLHSQLCSLHQMHENIWREEGGGDGTKGSSPRKTITPSNPSIWFVTQLLHDAGPPVTGAHEPYVLEEKRSALIKQMTEMIFDQQNYHAKAHRLNLKRHENLERVTTWVFIFVFIVVILHLGDSLFLAYFRGGTSSLMSGIFLWIHNQRYILLITAFVPALLAAFHDILSQMELKRVSENSKQMTEDLAALEATIKSIQDKNQDPITLRNLARELAQTLYQEHDAWGKLMKIQNLDIPA